SSPCTLRLRRLWPSKALVRLFALRRSCSIAFATGFGRFSRRPHAIRQHMVSINSTSSRN
ncbi:Os11g0466966, partial [Oryza sativa Japonica Group]